MTVKPYQDLDGSKKEQVRTMFDSIAPNYDFLNHFLSFNTDRKWRNKLANLVKSTWTPGELGQKSFLDIATGTGDLAFTLEKLHPESVTAVDLSDNMLEIAGKKGQKRHSKVTFSQADAENLPFPENHFDLVTVAFGVRNYEDLEKGLSEIFRVLKPGGWFYILEFSRPGKGLFSAIYRWYSHRLIPLLASPFSSDRKAYSYLPSSVEAFPSGDAFLENEGLSGFNEKRQFLLTGGIASIYRGYKP